MAEVRPLLNALLAAFPSNEGFLRYLSPDANIIHSQHFECGVTKVIENRTDTLNDSEKVALTPFELSKTEPVPAEEGDVVTAALQQCKRRKVSVQKYCDLSFISPTSSIAERLFSKSKLFLGDLRRYILPQHLEFILLLAVNREL
jgi:hypothetical protein